MSATPSESKPAAGHMTNRGKARFKTDEIKQERSQDLPLWVPPDIVEDITDTDSEHVKTLKKFMKGNRVLLAEFADASRFRVAQNSTWGCVRMIVASDHSNDRLYYATSLVNKSNDDGESRKVQACSSFYSSTTSMACSTV